MQRRLPLLCSGAGDERCAVVCVQIGSKQVDLDRPLLNPQLSKKVTFLRLSLLPLFPVCGIFLSSCVILIPHSFFLSPSLFLSLHALPLPVDVGVSRSIGTFQPEDLFAGRNGLVLFFHTTS